MTSPSLNPKEIVDIADLLAHAAEEGGVDARRALAGIGLSAAAFNLHQRAQAVWYEIVRAVHAGRSRQAGFHSDAVARLVAVLSDELGGNTDLAALAHRLGGAASDAAGAATAVAGTGPRSIFLSYASVDRADVDRLHASLKTLEPTVDVFQDHRSLALGTDWLQTLRDRAGGSSAMACWLTPAYLASAFCSYEIGIADSRRCLLLPIVVDAAVLGRLPAYLSRPQAMKPAPPPDTDQVAQAVLAALR